jgi:WD40 repeat protein/uncharacterized caspase-like protein
MNKGLRILCALMVLIFAQAIARAEKPELALQTGHSSTVTALVISSDGKRLASGSLDKTVILWDAESGKQLRSFAGHTEFITAVAISPDGLMLASGNTDDTVKLWQVNTGRELRTLAGHANNVTAIAFNPDGSILVSASTDKTLKLWSVKDGKELRTFTGHIDTINAVCFSNDGKIIASVSDDKTVKLWDAASGKEIATLTGHTKKVRAVAFSPDGQTLASASDDMSVKLWEATSGKELRAFTGHTEEVTRVVFDADGKMLVSMSLSAIKFWEITSGKEIGAVTERNMGAYSMAYDSNTNQLAIGCVDSIIKLWDTRSNNKPRILRGYAYPAKFIAFSPDGRTLASSRLDGVRIWDGENGSNMRVIVPSLGASVRSIAFSPDSQWLAIGTNFQKEFADFPDSIKKQLGIEETVPTIKIYAVQTSKLVRTIRAHEEGIYALAFSPDGKIIASGSVDKAIKLWDSETGAELRTLTGHTAKITSLAFRYDGKVLASGSDDKAIKVWETETGKELRTLAAHTHEVNSLAFSPDGKTLASGSFLVAALWDADSGQQIREFKGHTNMVTGLAFSRDGKQLATAGFDNLIKLWDVESGGLLQTLRGHSNTVTSVAFSPVDNLLASASFDANIKIWDQTSGSEIVSLVALGDKDWAVVAPEGRFDASPDGMKLMHWVVETEALELEQLKERYYEPKLFAKLMGFSREPLRDVSAFTEVQLPPGVAYEWLEKGGLKLKLKLTNRGGGIGRVQILVNGKEVVEDARPANFDASVKQATVIADLANASLLSGKANQIRIVTWNTEGYLSSRGAGLAMTSDDKLETAAPELYAIIGGISNYSSSALNLRFAAKDAEDFAKALEMGAKRLFGADKIHIKLLTSSSKEQASLPTKVNFKKAFEAARRARPGDIFLVYMAGHGVSLQRGNDLYCYLTQEARSGDPAAYADTAVRAATTISSDELVEWIKQIPALKQIMILDTCAAGAAQAKLTEKRDVPGDQIRAIERLKDRTGFHVLMGSAADAVSYETNQFEQGLLTYALLQGLRGAALREGEYMDVSRLFQFAADQVPRLAQNIGGVQKPVIAAPRGTSFDFGLLKKEDRDAIPLTLSKQMVLRPVLLHGQLGYDNLDLMALLRQRMIDDSYATARGEAHKAATIYIDAEELSGAIRPSGTYLTKGARVEVKMVLRKDDRTIKSYRVRGAKNQLQVLVERINKSIKQTIQNQTTESGKQVK